jgi:hypothetical protein
MSQSSLCDVRPKIDFLLGQVHTTPNCDKTQRTSGCCCCCCCNERQYQASGNLQTPRWLIRNAAWRFRVGLTLISGWDGAMCSCTHKHLLSMCTSCRADLAMLCYSRTLTA